MKKLILFILLSAAAMAQNNAPAGNADNGKRLFMRNGCYESVSYTHLTLPTNREV